MSYLIRKMEISDISEVLEIERQSFSEPWSQEAFENELANPDTHYYVWVEAEKIIAYIGFWKIFEQADITNLAVLPSYRGEGRGQTFVAIIKQKARELGIETMTLEVRESNRNAGKVYERNGFYVAGVRKDYYSKPTENALIMWAQLSKEEHYEHGTENS